MQSKLSIQQALRLSAAAGRRYSSVSSCSIPTRHGIIRHRWNTASVDRCCSPLAADHALYRWFSSPTSTTLDRTDNDINSTTTLTEQIQNDQTTLTNDQQSLLQYTQSFLREVKDIPAGKLSQSQISEMSSCIEQYISGAHSYACAEQVHTLLLRLIMERTAWQRYHLDGAIRYFDGVYNSGTFVDRMMSITAAFEEAYEEVPYKSIISLLCSCYSAPASTAAELILDRFETRLLSGNEPLYYHSNPPTVETYNAILTSWAKSGRRRHVKSSSSLSYSHHPNAPSNLVSQMLHLYNDNPSEMERIRPDFLSFNTAIASLTREQHFRSNNSDGNADHRTIGKVCFDHLQTMMLLYRQGNHALAPDLITFSTVMMTLGRGKDRDDESRAMQLLDEMLHLCGVDVEKVGREGIDGNVVLNRALFEQPTTFTELYEDGDFDQMNQGSSTRYIYNVIPRNKHFNVALALMAQTRKVSKSTLERARTYVEIMEQLGQYESETLLDNPPVNEELPDKGLDMDISTMSASSSKPDTITFNTLLKIAARAGEPEVADEIFQEMMTKYSEGNLQVKPDRFSFNTLLLAWSKEKRLSTGTRVTEILETMQEMADNGDDAVRPDHVSMTTVINTLAKSAKQNGSNPRQAESIISRMEDNKEAALRPDVVTYTSLIKCWMECGSLRAAGRAVEIIEKLHQRYEDGYLECKPDTMAYNVALNAIAKSRAVEGGAENAEALLQRMQDRFLAGDRDVAPSAPSFVTVMNAWARSKDPNRGKHAERLLQSMHRLHSAGLDNVVPNTVAYSTCIFAWSKSGQRNAGSRAQKLLEEMERYHSEGMDDMKPNVFTYTNVMEAWIASKQPDSLEKVESILEHMIEQSNAGDMNSAPNTTTFNVVLKAIRHSSHPEMHLKAEKVLERMKETGVKPNIITYNTFMGACARTEGDEETRRRAFSLVLAAFAELQANGLRADGYTWPAIWQACQCHLDVDADLPKINSLFDVTVQNGAFNELLFNSVRGFLPPSFLQKKLNRTDDVQTLTVHDLPVQWTRNVKLGRVKGPKKKNKR